MTGVGVVYRAVWPILDVDRPISALFAEASRDIDAMAATAGCRLVGAVRWRVDGERLYGEADAVPLDARPGSSWGSITRHGELITQLAQRGLTDRAIADLIGCSESGVAKVRQRLGVPGGTSRRALGRGEVA